MIINNFYLSMNPYKAIAFILLVIGSVSFLYLFSWVVVLSVQAILFAILIIVIGVIVLMLGVMFMAVLSVPFYLLYDYLKGRP